MARRFATRIGTTRANRFAEKPYIFRRYEQFARIPSNLRFAIFSPTKRDLQKMGFSSGTLKRFARIKRFANLRIDSRESIHAKSPNPDMLKAAGPGLADASPSLSSHGNQTVQPKSSLWSPASIDSHQSVEGHTCSINCDLSALYPAKSKRGREEGDGTENVINCRDVCRKLS